MLSPATTVLFGFLASNSEVRISRIPIEGWRFPNITMFELEVGMNTLEYQIREKNLSNLKGNNSLKTLIL